VPYHISIFLHNLHSDWQVIAFEYIDGGSQVETEQKWWLGCIQAVCHTKPPNTVQPSGHIQNLKTRIIAPTKMHVQLSIHYPRYFIPRTKDLGIQIN
jgi:hypothetical protein